MMISSQDLFKYARRYAQRAERKGHGTQFPTFREAARRFRVTLDAVEGAIDGHTGPGYMEAAVGIMCGAGIGAYKHKGDYQVEAYDD